MSAIFIFLKFIWLYIAFSIVAQRKGIYEMLPKVHFLAAY